MNIITCKACGAKEEQVVPLKIVFSDHGVVYQKDSACNKCFSECLRQFKLRLAPHFPAELVLHVEAGGEAAE